MTPGRYAPVHLPGKWNPRVAKKTCVRFQTWRCQINGTIMAMVFILTDLSLSKKSSYLYIILAGILNTYLKK